MPFMKGRAPLRRTLDYLKKHELQFRSNIKVITIAYNINYNQECEDATKKAASIENPYPHHDGLTKFSFWHLPQLQYNNKEVQFITFNKLTPTPWIKAYLDNDTEILIDCDSRSRQEIYNHVVKMFGKSKAQIKIEDQEESRSHNPANFGFSFDRQCICELPGQVPCPAYVKLPVEMTGKWKIANKDVKK